jgi:Big-like domain-containing protein
MIFQLKESRAGMNKRIAFAALLLLITGCTWFMQSRAFAQLLPPILPPLPGGSLIVNVTSPSSGSTVSGTVPVSASVSIVGTLTVANVEFFVDGNFIGNDSAPSYSVPWNTRTVGNGSHTLTAVARDVLGVRWTSNPRRIAVSNDITRPTVAINQAAAQADPTNSAPINFTVVFSEVVSGFTGTDVAISGTAGGTRTVSVTGGPSTYNVAVSGMTNGTVIATIAAGVAQDAAGNTNTTSTSTDNSVTFNTTADTTPPTVAITSPASGATVANTINVTANASDNRGVAGVQFRLDGANLDAEDTSAPYSVSWNTTSAGNGSHTLTAIARDVAGNSTTSAGVTVDVSNGSTNPPTRFEEDSAAVVASPADAWVRRGPEIAAFSGGTAGSSNVAGATVTFTFTGTAVNWIGLKCSVCGVATVSIDGGAATSVNTAGTAAPGSAGLASEAVFSASGLTPGTHTLVITVTGDTTSGDAHIIVDGFDAAGSPTGTGTTRVEDTDPAVRYTGDWVHLTDPRASAGTAAEAQTAGAMATLSFTGTGVRWFGFRYEGGGIARVLVDGVFVGEVDTYSPSPDITVVFTASGRVRGAHTLTIEVTGTRNPASNGAWVIIDSFEVIP